MIQSFPKEIIWPENLKVEFGPNTGMPNAWSLLCLLECSLKLHKESYYAEGCKIPAQLTCLFDLSCSATYCSNCHSLEHIFQYFPLQLKSNQVMSLEAYEILSFMNINGRDIRR